MKRNHLILLLPLALGFLCLLGTKPAGHETVKQVVQIASVEPTSPKIDAAPGNASEIQDYGQRESWSPQLSEFAGGHHHGDEVVIVGVGCGGLLIAILVLVILL